MAGSSVKKQIRIGYKNMIMLVSVSLAALILIVITIHSYRTTEQYILNRLNTINIGVLDQNASAVNNNMLQVKKLTDYLAADELLLTYLDTSYTGTPAERQDARYDLRARLNIMRQFNEYIDKIMLIVNEGPIMTLYTEEIFSLNRTMIAGSGLPTRLQAGNGAAFITPMILSSIPSAAATLSYLKNDYFFMADVRLDDQNAAYLLVFIDPAAFTDLISRQAALIDASGQVAGSGQRTGQREQNDVYLAYQDQISEMDTGLIETRQELLYFRQIEPIDMTLLLTQSKTDFTESIIDFRSSLLLMLALILLLAVILSRIIANLITRPLRRFSRFVKSYLFRQNDTGHSEADVPDAGSLSMRESILTYLTGVIILPTAIFLLAINSMSSNIIETYIIRSFSTAFTRAADNMNDFLSGKEKVLRNIIYNISLQQSLEQPTEQVPVDYDQIVSKDLLLGQGRDDVFLYGESGNLLYANTEAKANATVTRSDMEAAKGRRIIATWTDTVIDAYGRRLFSLLLKINSLDAFNNIGFLQYQMPEYELESVYRSISQGENTSYLVNQDMTVISHPDKSKIGTRADLTIPGESGLSSQRDDSRYTLSQSITGTGWHLVGHYELDTLRRDLQQLTYGRLYIFAFTVTMTIFVAFILAFGLTRSFNRINNLLHQLRMDQVRIIVPENSTINEVSDLARAFNEMIRRNEQLIASLLENYRKQADLENRRKQLELAALQYQINPHFLYNSFESINWLVKRERKAAAIQMVDSLSQFLRYVAHSDRAVVPLREEIDHTRHYIDVMDIRYNGQITVIWDIDETLLDMAAIRLSIQPLIENAIYHGIQASQEEGIIEVSCTLDETGEDMLISVSDNGAGMDEEKIKQVQAEINREEVPHHIGLHNIQSRIQLYFGQEYGISLMSRPGLGTTVTMRLPGLSTSMTSQGTDQTENMQAI